MTRQHVEIIDGREFVVTSLPSDKRLGQTRERTLINSSLTSWRVKARKLTDEQEIKRPRKRRRRRGGEA